MFTYLAKYPFKSLAIAIKYMLITLGAFNMLIILWVKSFFNCIDYDPAKDYSFSTLFEK